MQKKIHNGSENSENKKKYGVAENLAKKYHNLEPNGIIHNSQLRLEMRFFKNFKAQDKAQALGYVLVFEIF